MRVTVQCFARLRELAGRADWVLDLPDGATVADAWRHLAAEAPAVSVLASSVSSAVNAEFASMAHTLREGDDVAFLPPVSGGAPVRA